MKQPLPGLLQGILMPVMILLITTLIACEKGDADPDTKSGSASITNKDWKFPGNWKVQLAANSMHITSRYVDIPSTLITDDIMKNGTVMVYFNAGADEAFTPMPYVFQGINVDYHLSYEYKKGNIRLHFFFTGNPNTTSIPDVGNSVIKDYTFKYVVLPAATGTKLKNDEIIPGNYARVSDYVAVNR